MESRTNKPDNNGEHNNNTLKQAEEEAKELEAALDGKIKLNWLEKLSLKKLLKKAKKDLQKEYQKRQDNEKDHEEIRTRVKKAIMEMTEFFEVQINQYTPEGAIIKERNKPVEVLATMETLENLPTEELIRTWEQVLEEVGKII